MKTDLLLSVNNQIITKIPYFTGKSKYFCAEAANILKTAKVYKGDFIYQETDPITEINFLLNGEAGFVVSEDKVTVVFSKITNGNIFGELDYFVEGSVIPTGYRQFNVKATLDCELVTVSIRAINDLEKDYPKYIDEIFEFGPFRAKELCYSRDKAINKLSKYNAASKSIQNDDFGKGTNNLTAFF
jgi:hypothetical protein